MSVSIIYTPKSEDYYNFLFDCLNHQLCQDYELICVQTSAPSADIQHKAKKMGIKLKYIGVGKEKTYPDTPHDKVNRLNTGLLKATGDSVLFLEEGCWINIATIGLIRDHYKNQHHVNDIVGFVEANYKSESTPKTCPSEEGLTQQGAYVPNLLKQAHQVFIQNPTAKWGMFTMDFWYITCGAASMKFMRSINGFDENFDRGTWFIETCVTEKMKALGGRNLIIANCIVEKLMINRDEHGETNEERYKKMSNEVQLHQANIRSNNNFILKECPNIQIVYNSDDIVPLEILLHYYRRANARAHLHIVKMPTTGADHYVLLNHAVDAATLENIDPQHSSAINLVVSENVNCDFEKLKQFQFISVEDGKTYELLKGANVPFEESYDLRCAIPLLDEEPITRIEVYKQHEHYDSPKTFKDCQELLMRFEFSKHIEVSTVDCLYIAWLSRCTDIVLTSVNPLLVEMLKRLKTIPQRETNKKMAEGLAKVVQHSIVQKHRVVVVFDEGKNLREFLGSRSGVLASVRELDEYNDIDVFVTTYNSDFNRSVVIGDINFFPSVSEMENEIKEINPDYVIIVGGMSSMSVIRLSHLYRCCVIVRNKSVYNKFSHLLDGAIVNTTVAANTLELHEVPHIVADCVDLEYFQCEETNRFLELSDHNADGKLNVNGVGDVELKDLLNRSVSITIENSDNKELILKCLAMKVEIQFVDDDDEMCLDRKKLKENYDPQKYADMLHQKIV